MGTLGHLLTMWAATIGDGPYEKSLMEISYKAISRKQLQKDYGRIVEIAGSKPLLGTFLLSQQLSQQICGVSWG